MFRTQAAAYASCPPFKATQTDQGLTSRDLHNLVMLRSGRGDTRGDIDQGWGGCDALCGGEAVDALGVAVGAPAIHNPLFSQSQRMAIPCR